MPSTTLPATDLSAVALANSTHGLGHVNVAAANELGEVRSTPGIARRATWVAAPKPKVPPAIPAREIPSFEYRGHPVSSPEACPD